MMTGVRFIMRDEPNWEDALVVVAFPSAGSATSIAAHFLRRRLDLPLVGSIHVDHQAPVVAVNDGIATSPLRIHGGQTECKLGDERCPWVYLITSDLPLNPEGMGPVAEAILQETRGARLVLSLDAMAREPGDNKPDVYCASPHEALRDTLAGGEVTPAKEGIIVGMSGQLMLLGEQADLPTATLLVEAAETLPDGRAAAALIHTVDRLLPTIHIDAEPLMEEAMALEQEVVEAQKKAERAVQSPPSHTFI